MSDVPGNSELVRTIPKSELLQPKTPGETTRRRVRSNSEASLASPASSSKNRAAPGSDILPVIKTTVTETVDSINLTLSMNFAGFPNSALPKRASKEMCLRLDRAEYTALLVRVPWETFQNRA